MLGFSGTDRLRNYVYINYILFFRRDHQRQVEFHSRSASGLLNWIANGNSDAVRNLELEFDLEFFILITLQALN